MTNTQEQENNEEGRRPLKVRDAGLAQRCAVWLSNKNITPNQISIASVGFAALAAICLILLPKAVVGSSAASSFFSFTLPVLAAVFIQCRLLCNLFDGMVAVEGGKGTPAGELFNDIPDRIADPLLLVATGWAITSSDWGVSLGWCAGLLAVMTAYIRTLAASIGSPTDFQGPMAKQHRMAILTIACVITAIEATFWNSTNALLLSLIVIISGCLLTAFKRSRSAYQFLETQTQEQDT